MGIGPEGDGCDGHKEWLGLGSRNLNSKAFNITRTEVSTNFKIDIKSKVNTDTTTISAIIFTVFAHYVITR